MVLDSALEVLTAFEAGSSSSSSGDGARLRLIDEDGVFGSFAAFPPEVVDDFFALFWAMMSDWILS